MLFRSMINILSDTGFVLFFFQSLIELSAIPVLWANSFCVIFLSFSNSNILSLTVFIPLFSFLLAHLFQARLSILTARRLDLHQGLLIIPTIYSCGILSPCRINLKLCKSITLSSIFVNTNLFDYKYFIVSDTLYRHRHFSLTVNKLGNLDSSISRISEKKVGIAFK